MSHGIQEVCLKQMHLTVLLACGFWVPGIHCKGENPVGCLIGKMESDGSNRVYDWEDLVPDKAGLMTVGDFLRCVLYDRRPEEDRLCNPGCLWLLVLCMLMFHKVEAELMTPQPIYKTKC